MTPYDRLHAETAIPRNEFLSIPLVQRSLATGGTRDLYLGFLSQAFHHVKHTFPLLSLAAARTKDERFQDALFAYMKEERGHEKWILDDIRALGGDARKVASGRPGPSCEIMVGYAYYCIEHISPYAILGMVHVLEGLSTLLAHNLAKAVKTALRADGAEGFSYLMSHGSLDVEHVALFRSLVNGIEDSRTIDIIIEATRVFYRLYGAIFIELDHDINAEIAHAA